MMIRNNPWSVTERQAFLRHIAEQDARIRELRLRSRLPAHRP